VQEEDGKAVLEGRVEIISREPEMREYPIGRVPLKCPTLRADVRKREEEILNI